MFSKAFFFGGHQKQGLCDKEFRMCGSELTLYTNINIYGSPKLRISADNNLTIANMMMAVFSGAQTTIFSFSKNLIKNFHF